MSSTTELNDWLNGIPTGGPEGDGRYPLTYADGLTYLVYCPAAQALNPSVTELPIEVFSNTASSAAATATAEADEAEAASITAQTAAANAAASATAANTAKVSAQTAATNANTSATNAAASATAADASATEASGYVSVVDASATAATNSATAAALSETNANTAKTAAETARDKANDFANAALGVQVEPGLYSAKHWAQTASAALTGTLMYKGVWDASTAYPASPTTGWFYKVSVAGNATGTQYDVGDQIIYNGSGWDKIDNTEQVTSVAGRVGAITLATADITGLDTALSAKATLGAAASFGTLSGASLTHNSGYFSVKPFGVTYDDGSKIESYYDGNNRKWNMYTRDAANAVGDVAMAFNGKTVYTSGDSDTAATGGKLALRDANGDVHARLHRATFGDQTTISGAMAYRVNNGADNYLRYCSSQAAIRTWLDTPSASACAGLTFAQTLAPAVNDFSNQIQLWAGYGFSITTSRLNVVAASTATICNVIGTTDIFNINSTGVHQKNANSGTMTRMPRIFVQSGDPGAAAADGDLWFW